MFHVLSNPLPIVSCITERENVQKQHRDVRILTQSPNLLLPGALLIVPLVDILLILLQLLLLRFKQSTENGLPCITLGSPFEGPPREAPTRSRSPRVPRDACFPRWFAWVLRATRSVLTAAAALFAADPAREAGMGTEYHIGGV